MAKVLNPQTRKCDVMSNGPIAELGFVNGPVFNCKLTTDKIVTMVSNGKRVYEIDPNNSKNKILLTIGNCSTSPFSEVKPVEPIKVPVVEKPTQVVVENSQETMDPHKVFLTSIGKTEDEWRRMSKSERRRLKAQYEHDQQTQDVKEQIKTSEIESVLEAEEIASTPNEHEKMSDIEASVEGIKLTTDTEEAVVSADM